jgi:AAHS family benzoate transporter-like MFS transporter
VAWCAGFGRLGGIGGPLVGGLLITAGLALDAIFYVLVAMAVLGALLTLLVPTAGRTAQRASATASARVDDRLVASTD